jgi:hypothetical protein
LTGDAGVGMPGKPLLQSPGLFAAVSLASYLGASVGSVVALATHSFGWFVSLSLAALSFARRLQIVVLHHMSHGAFVRRGRWNEIVGDMCSILLIIQPYHEYAELHKRHHNPARLLTTDDETESFLFDAIRLTPGSSRRRNTLQLLSLFVNPSFHLRQGVQRILMNLFCSNMFYIAGFCMFWCGVIALSVNLEVLEELLSVLALVLLYGYNLSKAFRMIVEHRWPPHELLISRRREFIEQSTVAVFFQDPFARGRGLFEAVWLTVCALIGRTLVLVGDTPVHDYHHRYASENFLMNSYRRAREIEAGASYACSRGMWNAIGASLAAIEAAPQRRMNFCNQVEWLTTRSPAR